MLLRYRYLFMFFLLLALCPQLTAQRFKGAIMGGMNIAQVDGDEVVGYKRVGGHFGLAAILPIKNWDITLETVFNQKGAHEKPQYDFYDSLNSLHYTGEYNLRLNYVEVPLMAHYTDKDRITAGLGFSYGRLVSYSEVEHGGDVPPYSDTVEFNKNDFNFLVDIQLKIWKQLKFNVRFVYSIIPIRERTFHDTFYEIKDPWTRKQYNNMLTFRLVYVFNEQQRQPVTND
jgi:hypothetical protein